MSRNNKAAIVNISALPSVAEALRHYTSLGGTLTEPHPFGSDPLEGNPSLKQVRQDLFKERFPSFEPIFASTVAGDNKKFKEGLTFYIAITKRLSCCI